MLFDADPPRLVSGVDSAPCELTLSARKPEYRHCVFPPFAALVVAACLSSPLAAEEAAILLQTANQPGKFTRVHTVVEVQGELKVNPDGKKVNKLPLKGKGELVYHERLVSAGTGEEPRKDVRYYQTAEARFVVGEGEVATQLSADRRIIGVQSSPARSLVFSPLGPLTRDELELIDVQGSSSLLHRLLPDKETRVGDKWSCAHHTAAVLLRLDVVTENKLESVLKKIDGGIAYIEMEGSVSGSVGGVPSDLTVTAKYNFDQQLARITWLAMSIQENRAVGHAEPGLEVTARIRVSVSPLDASPELSDDVVAQLPVDADGGATYLTCAAANGHLRLIHPRSWRVMVDRHDVTVLRLLDRGDMIAQCNLSKLPDAPPKKLLSVETLQADIQRSLASNFSQFVEAKQFQTDRGLRALRVVVAGTASDLPIQWIYYHLTDSQGRQAALVFTFDANLVERFGGEDQALVSTLEFVPATTSPETSSPAKTADDSPPRERSKQR